MLTKQASLLVPRRPAVRFIDAELARVDDRRLDSQHLRIKPRQLLRIGNRQSVANSVWLALQLEPPRSFAKISKKKAVLANGPWGISSTRDAAYWKVSTNPPWLNTFPPAQLEYWKLVKVAAPAL